jgi:hypothetical protein
MKMPLREPGEDDGHLISHLVLGQVAEEVERQYSREQAVVFLRNRASTWTASPHRPN